ncbi:MAG: hypothetical protein RL095_2476 [Verrucomicrobiota bacterium]|jgi:hypothetical protein
MTLVAHISTAAAAASALALVVSSWVPFVLGFNGVVLLVAVLLAAFFAAAGVAILHLSQFRVFPLPALVLLRVFRNFAVFAVGLIAIKVLALPLEIAVATGTCALLAALAIELLYTKTKLESMS